MFNIIAGIILILVVFFIFGLGTYLRAYIIANLMLKVVNELLIPVYKLPPFPYPIQYITIALVTYAIIRLMFANISEKTKYSELSNKEKAIEMSTDYLASFAKLGIVWYMIEVVVWVYKY